MTLTEFLTARLDEDQAVAEAATEGPWAWEATGEKDNSWAVGLVQHEDGTTLSGQIEAGEGVIVDGVCEGIDGNLRDAEHIARHDPARVLRQVEAGRKILAEHGPCYPVTYPESSGQPTCGVCHAGGFDWDPCDWPCVTVRALGAAFGDHPDYQQEWSPA